MELRSYWSLHFFPQFSCSDLVKSFCRSTGGAADNGHRGLSFGVMCLVSMFGSSEVSRFCFMDYILLVAKPLSNGKMKLVLVCQLSWNKTFKSSQHCLCKHCVWVGLEFSNCPECSGASPEGQWSFVYWLYSGLCCNYSFAWVCFWCCCWKCTRQVCCLHCLRCRGVVR